MFALGDVFCGTEAEARSAIEDFALEYAKLREGGLIVGDLELDANVPALKNISHQCLLKLWAQAGQLARILEGKREVSPALTSTSRVWDSSFS